MWNACEQCVTTTARRPGFEAGDRSQSWRQMGHWAEAPSSMRRACAAAAGAAAQLALLAASRTGVLRAAFGVAKRKIIVPRTTFNFELAARIWQRSYIELGGLFAPFKFFFPISQRAASLVSSISRGTILICNLNQHTPPSFTWYQVLPHSLPIFKIQVLKCIKSEPHRAGR